MPGTAPPPSSPIGAEHTVLDSADRVGTLTTCSIGRYPILGDPCDIEAIFHCDQCTIFLWTKTLLENYCLI